MLRSTPRPSSPRCCPTHLAGPRAAAGPGWIVALGCWLLTLPVPLLSQPAVAEGVPSPSLAEAAPTISIDEVARGQMGYGLSVFAGTEPDRFEVEVLGVMHHTTPELSYVLARLSGQDLERSGVVAGMSGSPVYLEERLAGAVAFSYPFGKDAIAGITPIDAMRRLSQLPAAAALTPVRAPAGLEVSLQDLTRRDVGSELLTRQLERWAGASPEGWRSSVQWSAAGFGDVATDLLRGSLGEVHRSGAIGGASAGIQPELGPGSAVAAVLVQGDLLLAAHGTVTERVGDEVLAFGHPMFSLGPVNLPLAPSEVITVIANAASSFKVSNAGPVIGAFDQDREAGVRGRLGERAPTTPIDVRLRGLSERDYHMEVADLPQMRPILLTLSALGAMTSGTYSAGYQGVDLAGRIRLADYSEVTFRQSFDGDQAALDSALYLLSFVAYLEYNPLVEVELEGVEVELTQVDRPRTATLLAAHPERTRVEPGGTVALNLELQAYRGDRVRRRTYVEVPQGAPDGRYVVLIGDGTSMDAARLSIENRSPATFEQALELLRSLRSRRELAVIGLAPATGLAVAGEALPDLPGSVRSIFAAGGRSVGSPLWLKIVHEHTETLKNPIEGIVRVDLEVRRRAR